MPQSLVQNIQHTVFSTKERYKWIDNNWEASLFKQIGGTLNRMGCRLLENIFRSNGNIITGKVFRMN